MIDPTVSIPLFDGLDEAARTALIQIATVRACESDDAIIHEGDPGEGVFVIAEGEVTVEKATIGGRPEMLTTLGPGECFGELSLVDQGRRSATVRAKGPARLLVFARDALDRHFDAHGDVHRTVLKNLAVITSRRLRRLDEAVVENAYDSVLVIDSGFRILKFRQVTEKAALMDRQTAAVSLGMDLFDVLPRLGEGVRQKLTSILAAREPAHMNLEYEQDDGDLAYFDLTVAPEAEGASIGIRDVTASRALEMRLVQSERLAMSGQMAAEIGHELRNYLTVLMGHVDLLGLNPGVQADERLGKSLGVIGEQLERIERFASELMRLGQLKLRKEPSDVNELIANLVAFIQGQTRFRQVEFALNLDARLPPLEADPGQIQQVLMNLFANAADAMGAGTITVTTCVDDLGRMVVRVADTGPGMGEDVVEKIFDTGFTTKETGHGFGLGVCRRIVENHAGEMELETEVGVGTTFTLRFEV